MVYWWCSGRKILVNVEYLIVKIVKGVKNMDNNKQGSPAKRTDFRVQKGECLFPKIYIQLIEKEIKLINENYTRYLNHIRKANDDRLLAIVGALAVDDALDSLLKSYIPKYEQTFERDNTSFALKIKLARSLKLLQTRALKLIDIIRGIRNDFAHNLDIYHFDSIDKKKKDKLIKIFREVHPDDDYQSYSISKMFSIAVTDMFAILSAQATQLKVAKEYIYGDDFQLKIREIIRDNS